MEENETMETKESFSTKAKKFVLRNRRKFIIFGGILGGTLLGGGLLKKHLQDDGEYVDCVEEDYESVEYIGDPDDSTDETDSSEE